MATKLDGPLGPVQRVLIGSYSVVTGIFFLWALYGVWPPGSSGEPRATSAPDTLQTEGDSLPAEARVTGSGLSVRQAVDSTQAQAANLRFLPRLPASFPQELRYLLLVMVAGGLGGSLRGMRSFATHAGEKTLLKSYAWFYWTQPPTGMIIAVPMYFLLRAGLFNVGDGASQLNPYGWGAIAVLGGMFSNEAILKLKDTFIRFFGAADLDQSQNTAERMQQASAIDLAMVDTKSVAVGRELTITLSGRGFRPESKVLFDGKELSTIFVGPTELKAKITATHTSTAGTYKIQVIQPDGRASQGIDFEVTT